MQATEIMALVVITKEHENVILNLTGCLFMRFRTMFSC